MTDVQRPPPRATLPPTRSRAWTAGAHRSILTEELCSLPLYRRLVSSEADAALLAQLEREFTALVESAGEDGEDLVCVRFPVYLPSSARALVAACARRFKLRPESFGEEEKRFMAVYMHPRSAVIPVLRLEDFAHATSYYALPPPPPASTYDRRRDQFGRRPDSVVELEAPERPLRHDYSSWRPPAPEQREPVGYECEAAGCHAHLIELASFEPELDAAGPLRGAVAGALRGALPGLITLRPLPAGFVAVFSSAAAAEAATIAHRQFPHDVGGEGEGADWPRDLSLALPGGERRCRARPLSLFAQRPRASGRGGAPRALQAALRGVGGGGGTGGRGGGGRR